MDQKRPKYLINILLSAIWCLQFVLSYSSAIAAEPFRFEVWGDSNDGKRNYTNITDEVKVWLLVPGENERQLVERGDHFFEIRSPYSDCFQIEVERNNAETVKRKVCPGFLTSVTLYHNKSRIYVGKDLCYFEQFEVIPLEQFPTHFHLTFNYPDTVKSGKIPQDTFEGMVSHKLIQMGILTEGALELNTYEVPDSIKNINELLNEIAQWEEIKSVDPLCGFRPWYTPGVTYFTSGASFLFSEELSEEEKKELLEVLGALSIEPGSMEDNLWSRFEKGFRYDVIFLPETMRDYVFLKKISHQYETNPKMVAVKTYTLNIWSN